ncbi:DSBA-like thioredoxin domain-containing protein [Cercophora newfieldiana]|uniref:DSBA-like thioredoxin domain-containing protein n=1 Tax=Cercophora newfieldiana TaxID=92897 RepID=A0AA39YBC0_9PEZI|nr:DSBA-like thioredoxin domain-containing protein [Cercophora newfieldiana]
MTNFHIKIVSDAICPWCTIGKKRLETAIDLYKKTVSGGENDSFTVTWHPFYLDPTLPKVGVDSDIHMANKFGPERAAMMTQRLIAMGQMEGINFSGRGKLGNTRDAHRLVQLAKTKSNALENRVVSELFKSHFEQGGDVTSYDMLIDAGEKAGLDRAETKRWLEEGAQDPQTFLQQFIRIKDSAPGVSTSSKGATC